MDLCWMLTLVLVTCYCFETASTQQTGSLSAYKMSSFQNPDSNAKLNRVLLHSPSGNVYVGAANSIYRLNNNLEHQRNISTANKCVDERNCVNNNKVLFVEPLRNALITCGSYTGQCQLRHAEELTVTAEIETLVASDEDKTTVSILAPGPGNKDWLYVAATFTSTFPRNQIRPVSRRLLDLIVPNQNLLLARPNARVDFDSDYKGSPFDINYVYGFSSTDYVYYVTSQQIATNINTGVSKVVRVCHQANVLESAPPDLDAYTEITIQCGEGPSVYPLAQAAHVGPAGPSIAASLGIDSSDLMLYAIFTKDDTSSALCMFSMSDVEDAFFNAVDNCIKGNGGDSVSYLEGSRCNTINVDASPYLCETSDLYKYANNPNAVESPTLLERPGIMSSIATSIEMNHTIAFIGTASGELLKVHIESGTSARHYETVKLGEAPVLRDISLDDTKQEINILTEQQLLKLRVENCSQYTTCETCIGKPDSDPYCGWCTLENRCTRHDDCEMADQSSRWLSYNEIQCVEISDIAPYRSLPITEPQRMITLTVEQLPELEDDETYSCQFNDLPQTQGMTDGNNVTCSIPAINARPQIPASEDAVKMKLSVFSSETVMTFISTDFYFYDCTQHQRCGDCVQSRWDCDWCVFDNTCTHQSTQCTAGDTIITGLNNPDGGENQGPGFCPQIQRQGGEVLVPVDISREIFVNVSNLPESNMITYECSLMIEDERQTVQATQEPNDVIKCNSRMYTYKADNVNELKAQLFISWRGNRDFDDFHKFNVTLYKCNVDRRDCSRCLAGETTRPELECRWCSTQCSHRESDMCSNSVLAPGGQCPAPFLETVTPPTGPIEGNTVIAVTGTDIGQQFQDVTSVMVGQKQCNLAGLEDEYITGQSVSCLTAPSNSDIEQTITISVARVDGGADLSSTGTVKFAYKNPEITSFSPDTGPAAGGTLIQIIGQHMDTGRDIRAMIGTNIACEIKAINNTAIGCTSGNSTVGNTGVVSVTFDGAVRESQELFTYQFNPTVSGVQPTRSVETGGRLVNVTGEHFRQIQAPKIVMSAGDDTFKENCTVQTDGLMMCTTPNVSMAFNGSRSTAGTENEDAGFTVGFMLANLRIKLDKFTYVKDPVFDRFDGDEIHDLEGSKLQIHGERLDDALTASEVMVFVGTETCTVEVLANSILTCQPPKSQPRPTDVFGKETSNSLPTVYVQYSMVKVRIGFLRYNSDIDVGLYIGIAAAVCLVPIAALAIFLWRKLRGSRKEIGEILLQMDDLEKGMAEDLRIAFAELQTNVTDLTHDLAGTGMPFVSHRQYATNMLFTGLDIQPLTYDPENPEERTERAMVQFNKLLVNKTFLLAFIQALDDDKKTTVKDKSTIASLLTVVMMLENKLGYLTDIMITLMSNQVGEAVDNNRPKQLFRRTETIVEKLLSNWIALCLYDQLQDRTAFPLFLLYSGIKVQTEKGPVDAVTRQAHFSLSEERLLRGSVDFKEMTLNVVVDNEDGEKKEVRVLDVDAVPQVKEKILDSMYRNKPYSNRQRANKVNLEWRQGRSGRLALQDAALPQMALTDDKQVENLQKLNTLKELGIPDNSLMALVPKETLHTSINEATSGYGPNDASLYPRDTELENGTIFWHLEKPQDEVEESEKQKKKRQKELALGKGNKKTRDITFPRLLTMKGIIQEYVDNMFQAILTVESTPMAIKYLFDFFDSQASRHDIDDPDIVHIWKSNTFPLRFWVSSITHPNYIFDIRPTPSVESSLGVVGQAFYDACNKSDHQLGWESSVNKLLYNREVNRYRGQVESYYQGIEEMDRIETSDLQREFDKTCQNFTGLFSKLSTLLQLYEFTNRNKDLLLRAMEEDDICEQENLAYELEQVDNILQDE